MPPSNRFTFVDALRAIAALSVVLFHALEGDHIPIIYGHMPSLLQVIIAHANAGVAIFFVLSGFVISHSLAGKELTIPDVGRFMLKRSLRLDPPYWVAIAISCAIVFVKGGKMFPPFQIAAHLTYTQDLLGIDAISPIFWTLCLEVQFYLVFALLLLSRSRFLMIAAFLISIPLSVVILWHGLFTSLWYGFLLGAGAYMSWQNQRTARWFWLYAATLQILAVIADDWFMTICVMTSLALYVVAATGKISSAMNWRWIQYLGTVSYSLYLVHGPATGVAFRLGERLFGSGLGSEVVSLLGSLAASVMAASLMFWLIENPSIMLSRMVGLGVLANAKA